MRCSVFCNVEQPLITNLLPNILQHAVGSSETKPETFNFENTKETKMKNMATKGIGDDGKYSDQPEDSTEIVISSAYIEQCYV
ncbi:hypothetical protein ACA910_005412 [Epithemia clementina (nom. ined.)]